MSKPDEIPDPPEDIADYDMGSGRDAIADASTDVVWVADHEREMRWWFELRRRVPLRKKNQILEDNVDIAKDGSMNVASDYYTDMLEYMIVSWSGEDAPDAPGLRELLTGCYAGTDTGNPTFERLQEEVPPPFASIPDTESGK